VTGNPAEGSLAKRMVLAAPMSYVAKRMTATPATAHFVWFGEDLPWVYGLALRSAALRGGFDRVVLHHERVLSQSSGFAALTEIPGVETRVLDEAALLEACPDGPALVDVYRELSHPAARSNLVRIAVLFGEGGVYLDTDTITVRSFDDLREPGVALCGQERVVYPAGVRGARDPRVRAAAFVRRSARALLREVPGGWRAFRHIERYYPAAVNNAVLGAPPRHPFISRLLGAALEVPPERRKVRFALGTHLLQQVVEEWRGRPGLAVHVPAVFYPLGPEISAHWFRIGTAPLDEVLRPETRLVHWYASVRTRDLVPRIDAHYVEANAGRQLFSALARPLL